MNRGRVVVSFAAVALTVAACGGETTEDAPPPSGGGIACGVVPACGGDPTGTWTLTTECLVGTATNASCPDETTSSSSTVSGSITFDGAGKFHMNATFGVDIAIGVPASCLKGVSDCQLLAQEVETELPSSTATCTGMPSSSCDCTVTATVNGMSDGTYTTSSARLVETNSTGQPRTRSYCVEGTTLTMTTDNVDGTTTVVVATR